MAEAVQADGVKSWVAKQHLQPPASSRVALANDGEIGSDLIKHRRGSAGGRGGLKADLLAEQIDRIGAEVTLGAVQLRHAHQL